MKFGSCPREKEVKKLVELGQWPVVAETAPELRAHVNGCRACSEMVTVTMAFRQARADAPGEVKIGSPGLLWWRAQLRQRNAAVERIGRPILGAQIFALAVNLVLVVGFVAWQARHGFGWINWLEQLPQTATVHLDSLWSSAIFSSGWGSGWGSVLTPMVLIPVLATLALVGGVVVYLASEKQ